MESLNNILDKLDNRVTGQKPFVIYSKPGESFVTGLFQKDNALYTSNYGESGFIMAPFVGTRNLFIPEAKSEILLSEFVPGSNNPMSPPELEVDSKSKESFRKLVQKAIEAIKSEHFSKVVLSRTIIIKLHEFNLAAVILNLLEEYPSAFRYCFFHPSAGLWIGATPERLLKTKGSKFFTVALAGTQKFIETDNVVWQEKEKQEQQFVTDYITSNLQPLTTEFKVSTPFTQKAGSLLHIKTEIEGITKSGSGIRGIIDILHPTPAVCGLPKVSAKEFILENEGYNREYYSGYLGELKTSGEGAADIYVNLRCMQIKNSEALLYVGCGITKDSDPEAEFMETVNKSMTMRKILI